MPATFRALRHRDFRALWLGLMFSATGGWLQIVAQSLLVLRLSGGSALALGAVSLAQGVAFFIFVLLGGVLADRYAPRSILLITQTLSLLLTLALALLTLSGAVSIWSVVVLSFLSSAASSFDQPARAALLPRLVPEDDLGNAVALQTLAFNTAATLGPSLAGGAVATLGFSGTFFVNAVSFAGVLLALAKMRLPEATLTQQGTRLTPREFVRASLEGVSAVRASATLSFALVAYGLIMLVGPSTSLLLPLLATQLLAASDARLGLLFSAAGFGTICGALFIASLPESRSKPHILLLCLGLWSGTMAALSLLRNFYLVLLIVFFWGATRNAVGTLAGAILQLNVAEALRARVMSLNALMVMGARPLGDFFLAFLVSAVTLMPVILGSAAVVGIQAVWLALRRLPRLNQGQPK